MELELKLQVPPSQLDEVAAALALLPGGARRIHLEAHYLDTPSYLLASNGLAWRLRREDDRWVQTLKTHAGGTAFGRLEHNVPLQHAAATAPDPDPTLHAGTPAGDRLLGVLAAAGEPIGVRYRTDIERLVAMQEVHDGGTVELALDRGVIVAGDRSTDVHELEIELVDGSPSDVVLAAKEWAGRWGLCPDAMHKARRGMLLARGVTVLPVVHAGNGSTTALVAAIRSNLSAVVNRMGGAEHAVAAATDLRRVAPAIGEPRAGELAMIADAIERNAGSADVTHEERISLLADLTVVMAVIDLLHLVG